jgi:hypothetical protein
VFSALQPLLKTVKVLSRNAVKIFFTEDLIFLTFAKCFPFSKLWSFGNSQKSAGDKLRECSR